MANKDFKSQLKEVKEQIKNEKPVKENKQSKKALTFNIFKKKIVELGFIYHLIQKMQLNYIDNVDVLIVYQGLKSNVIARIKRNGQHIIHRAALRKKMSKLINQYKP